VPTYWVADRCRDGTITLWVILTALSFASPSRDAAGAGTKPADAIAAKTQFCASCHGVRGLPSDQTVPIIWGQQAAYLRKQLDDYRDGDRDSQIMSSIAESLSDDQVSAVAGYFAKAGWPALGKSSPVAAPAVIGTCRVCHGANLVGAVTSAGAAPRLAGQNSPYLIDTMTMYADGERANSAVMSAVLQNLSPKDRRGIADYLAAMR
jgi:cytochrome c553